MDPVILIRLPSPSSACPATCRRANRPLHRLAAITLLLGVWTGLANRGNLLAAEPDTPRITGRLIASPEPGWPQWRGPRRDGICDETGLLARWPDTGPPQLWKATGLGQGYSAPIITGGRIYLTGEVDDTLQIHALDREGRPLWRKPNGASWKGPYPGARACCAFSEDRVYHLNAHGRVACLEADSGAEVWALNLFDEFGGKNLTWALAECLLVDGPRLIVTPGGSRALMVALDKKTGATVWTTSPLRLGQATSPAHERVLEPDGDIDSTSYGSPILFELGGRRHLVSSSQQHVFGVDADTGELLWTRPLPTRYSVIAATPVLVGDAVFVTAPDTDFGGLFQVRVEPEGVQVLRRWTTELDTCHGGVVLIGDQLVGAWYRRRKGWASLDVRTGAVRHESRELAMGSVLYADGQLYCLGQDGEMALMRLGPDGFKVTSRFRLVPDRKSDAWTHPVILDGRLYLRYQDTLFCYDIRAHPR